jgi:uridine kinase
VIPIAFLFASLYNLFNKRLYLSSLLLGLALSTKTNIAIVYPFFCFFLIAQNVRARDILIFLILSISVFVVLNLPYLLDEGFIQMVFYNQEQSKIFNASLALNGIKFYCVPAFFIFTFIQGGLLQHYNKNIFIMFLGFLFSIILLFIPPMPGWYFWLIPFLAYFYSVERGRSWFLFLGLQIAYLIYFAISKNSDYLSVFQPIFPDIAAHDNLYKLLSNAQMDSTFFVNIAFTLLQSLLCINCVWLYRRGLNQYCKYKIISHPFLLGIGGDSGAGKSFISNCLANIFTPEKTCLIRGDDRHKWTRGHEKWQQQTHLNPKSNALHEEIYFLKKLKQGKIQYRKHYDHSTGQFTSAQPVIANHLLLYEGLHPFYISAQSSLYDAKIFIKPEKDLLCHWKIIRDINERCHTKESILKSIRSRETDMKKYIQTQTDKADILIEPLLLSPIQNIGDPNELLHVFYKILLSNAVYIEPLLEALNAIESLTINHQYLENDVQLVILKGDCSALELQMLAQTYIPGLEELGVIQSDWPKGILGVLLLLLVHYIFEKAAYERE